MPNPTYAFTKQTFVKKLREKYPQYSDLSDDALFGNVTTKYPAYLDQVDPASVSTPSSEKKGLLAKLAAAVGGFFPEAPAPGKAPVPSSGPAPVPPLDPKAFEGWTPAPGEFTPPPDAIDKTYATRAGVEAWLEAKRQKKALRTVGKDIDPMQALLVGEAKAGAERNAPASEVSVGLVPPQAQPDPPGTKTDTAVGLRDLARFTKEARLGAERLGLVDRPGQAELRPRTRFDDLTSTIRNVERNVVRLPGDLVAAAAPELTPGKTPDDGIVAHLKKGEALTLAQQKLAGVDWNDETQWKPALKEYYQTESDWDKATKDAPTRLGRVVNTAAESAGPMFHSMALDVAGGGMPVLSLPFWQRQGAGQFMAEGLRGVDVDKLSGSDIARLKRGADVAGAGYAAVEQVGRLMGSKTAEKLGIPNPAQFLLRKMPRLAATLDAPLSDGFGRWIKAKAMEYGINVLAESAEEAPQQAIQDWYVNNAKKVTNARVPEEEKRELLGRMDMAKNAGMAFLQAVPSMAILGGGSVAVDAAVDVKNAKDEKEERDIRADRLSNVDWLTARRDSRRESQMRDLVVRGIPEEAARAAVYGEDRLAGRQAVRDALLGPVEGANPARAEAVRADMAEELAAIRQARKVETQSLQEQAKARKAAVAVPGAAGEFTDPNDPALFEHLSKYIPAQMVAKLPGQERLRLGNDPKALQALSADEIGWGPKPERRPPAVIEKRPLPPHIEDAVIEAEKRAQAGDVDDALRIMDNYAIGRLDEYGENLNVDDWNADLMSRRAAIEVLRKPASPVTKGAAWKMGDEVRLKDARVGKIVGEQVLRKGRMLTVEFPNGVRAVVSDIEVDAPVKTAAPAPVANTFTVKSPLERNVKASGRWDVVELDQLFQGPQDRNRTRAASSAQAEQIFRNFDEEELGDSVTSDRGAPIVLPDGRILAGHGRRNVLMQAYGVGDARADRYRQFVQAQTATRGLAEKAKGLREPVLVRVVDNIEGATPEKFAELSNKRQMLGYSEAEKAVKDARRLLSTGLISKMENMDPDNLLSVKNRDFIGAFLEGQDDAAEYWDAQGLPAPALEGRLQRAVLSALVMGDATAGGESQAAHTVATLVEKAEEYGVTPMLKGLTASAPRLLKIRADKQAWDITGELARVLPEVLRAKRAVQAGTFRTVELYFKQADFTRTATPADLEIATLLLNVKSAKQATELLDDYAKVADHTDSDTQDMFAGTLPESTKLDVLRRLNNGQQWNTIALDINAANEGKRGEGGPGDRQPEAVGAAPGAGGVGGGLDAGGNGRETAAPERGGERVEGGGNAGQAPAGRDVRDYRSVVEDDLNSLENLFGDGNGQVNEYGPRYDAGVNDANRRRDGGALGRSNQSEAWRSGLRSLHDLYAPNSPNSAIIGRIAVDEYFPEDHPETFARCENLVARLAPPGTRLIPVRNMLPFGWARSDLGLILLNGACPYPEKTTRHEVFHLLSSWGKSAALCARVTEAIDFETPVVREYRLQLDRSRRNLGRPPLADSEIREEVAANLFGDWEWGMPGPNGTTLKAWTAIPENQREAVRKVIAQLNRGNKGNGESSAMWGVKESPPELFATPSGPSAIEVELRRIAENRGLKPAAWGDYDALSARALQSLAARIEQSLKEGRITPQAARDKWEEAQGRVARQRAQDDRRKASVRQSAADRAQQKLFDVPAGGGMLFEEGGEYHVSDRHIDAFMQRQQIPEADRARVREELQAWVRLSRERGTPYLPGLGRETGSEGAVPDRESAAKTRPGQPARVTRREERAAREAQARAAAREAWTNPTRENWDRAFELNGKSVSTVIPALMAQKIPGVDVRGMVVDSSAKAAGIFWLMKTPLAESFKVLALDRHGAVLQTRVVSTGILNGSLAHPREVFRNLPEGTAAVVLGHNHPSGKVNASPEDIRITRQLVDAGKILDIPVVDHVVTNGTYLSIKGLGVIEFSDRQPFVAPGRSPIKKADRREAPSMPDDYLKENWEIIERTKRPEVRKSNEAADYFERLGNRTQSGMRHVLLLDTQNGVAAALRVPIDQTANEVFRAVARESGETGIAAFIVETRTGGQERKFARDLERMGAVYGVKMLDALEWRDSAQPGERPYESLREAGILTEPLYDDAFVADAVRESAGEYGKDSVVDKLARVLVAEHKGKAPDRAQTETWLRNRGWLEKAAPMLDRIVGRAQVFVESGEWDAAIFRDDLKKYIQGSLPSQIVLRLGTASSNLQRAGLPGQMIELTQSVIRYAQEERGIEVEALNGLPEALGKPLAVFRSETDARHYVVLTGLESNGEPIVAVLRPDAERRNETITDIRSLHPKQSGNTLKRWFDEQVLYFSEEGKKWARRTLAFPAGWEPTLPNENDTTSKTEVNGENGENIASQTAGGDAATPLLDAQLDDRTSRDGEGGPRGEDVPGGRGGIWDPRQDGGSVEPTTGRAIMTLPALVRLYRDVMGGKLPDVKKRLRLTGGTALGAFYPGDGKIVLKADIFDPVPQWRKGELLQEAKRIAEEQDGDVQAVYAELLADEYEKPENQEPRQALATLAHEIGHAYDWFPDRSMSKGNILGRIAALHEYMGGMLGAMPANQAAIFTEEERREIRAEAEKQARAQISPAGRSASAGEREARDKAVAERTAELYAAAIASEAKARGLISRDDIMAELKALSQWWKPFDEKANQNFTEYRYSSPELMADAISVMMNRPEALRRIAPQFDKALFAWMGERPEFQAAWDQIQAELLGGESDKRLIEDLHAGYREAEEIERGKLTAGTETGWAHFVQVLRYGLIDTADPILRKVKEVGEAQLDAWANPRYALEDALYVGSVHEAYLHELNRDVLSGLKARGISVDVMGDYMLAQRVLGERGTMANPLGVDKPAARRILERIGEVHGPSGVAALETARKAFWELRQKMVIDPIARQGAWSADLMAKVAENDDYATFAVVDYLKQQYGASTGPKVYRQIGTLKTIKNPLVATIQKDLSLISATARNEARKSVVSFMREHFPTEVEPARTQWNGKIREAVEPNDGKRSLLGYMADGKFVGFYVDKWIAKHFTHEDPGAALILARGMAAMNAPFRTLFVDANPEFWMANQIRDVGGAVMHLPDATYVGKKGFLKHWAAGLKPSYRSVFGNTDDTVQEMLKGKMLISMVQRGQGAHTEDTEVDRLLVAANLPTTEKRRALRPVEMLAAALEWWTKWGKVGERSTQIGVYTWLKTNHPELSEQEMAHLVRTVASPAFLRKGAAYPWTNNVLMFSNAIKEGWRAEYEAANRSKGAWFMRMMKYAILPKLAIWSIRAGVGAALLGKIPLPVLDGDDDDDTEKRDLFNAYRLIPEYDLLNYLCVPMGFVKGGKVVYLRIPQMEQARFLTGFLWKVAGLSGINQASPNPVTGLTGYAGGEVPNAAPWASIGTAWGMYAVGMNPLDLYRGGNWVNDDVVWSARDRRTLATMARRTAEESGLKPIMALLPSDSPDVAGSFEKAMKIPGLRRFVKVSDRGLAENLRVAREKQVSENARQTLDRRDVAENVRSGKALSPSDLEVLAGGGADYVVDRVTKGSARDGAGPLQREMMNARTRAEKQAVLDAWDKWNSGPK